MNVSIQKLHDYGYPVCEICLSDALKLGQFIHRGCEIFASPELRDDIKALYPKAVEVRVAGIVTDVPEIRQ